MTFQMTGGLISPPQSCSNSPAIAITTLSVSRVAALSPAPFATRRDFPDGTEDSGHAVAPPERHVLPEQEDGCLGTGHHHLSVASPLISPPSTSDVPGVELPDSLKQSGPMVEQGDQQMRTENDGGCPASGSGDASVESPLSSSSSLVELPQAEFPESPKHTGPEVEEPEQGVLTEEESRSSSSADGDILSRSRRGSVASSLSSMPDLSEDEDGDPMGIVEQNSTGHLSEEEQEDIERTVEDGEAEPMAGIEAQNLALNSVDPDGGDAMDVDADTPVEPRRSVRNAAANPQPRPQSDHDESDMDSDSSMEPATSDEPEPRVLPRRSSRHAVVKKTPQPASVARKRITKPKTLDLFPHDVRIQNFSFGSTSVLCRMTPRTGDLSSLMLGKQQFVWPLLNMITQ